MKFQSAILLFLFETYHEFGWVQQLHLGALRNNNRRSWDSKHLAIFDKYAGKDLLLRGKGFGWWEIKNPSKQNIDQEIGENYPRKSNSSYYKSPEGRDKPMHSGTNIEPQ